MFCDRGEMVMTRFLTFEWENPGMLTQVFIYIINEKLMRQEMQETKEERYNVRNKERKKRKEIEEKMKEMNRHKNQNGFSVFR